MEYSFSDITRWPPELRRVADQLDRDRAAAARLQQEELAKEPKKPEADQLAEGEET